MRLPTSFLPNEDQGYVIVNVQLPPGATQERTQAVMEQVEDFMLQAARSAKHGRRSGLQLLGPGAERRVGLCHTEGLVRAHRPGPDLRGRWLARYGGADRAFVMPSSLP